MGLLSVCPWWTSPHGCVCGGDLSPWPLTWAFPQPPRQALSCFRPCTHSTPLPCLCRLHFPLPGNPCVCPPYPGSPRGVQLVLVSGRPRGAPVFVCTPVTASIATGRPLFILSVFVSSRASLASGRRGPVDPGERVRAPGSQAVLAHGVARPGLRLVALTALVSVDGTWSFAFPPGRCKPSGQKRVAPRGLPEQVLAGHLKRRSAPESLHLERSRVVLCPRPCGSPPPPQGSGRAL